MPDGAFARIQRRNSEVCKAKARARARAREGPPGIWGGANGLAELTYGEIPDGQSIRRQIVQLLAERIPELLKHYPLQGKMRLVGENFIQMASLLPWAEVGTPPRSSPPPSSATPCSTTAHVFSFRQTPREADRLHFALSTEKGSGPDRVPSTSGMTDRSSGRTTGAQASLGVSQAPTLRADMLAAVGARLHLAAIHHGFTQPKTPSCAVEQPPTQTRASQCPTPPSSPPQLPSSDPCAHVRSKPRAPNILEGGVKSEQAQYPANPSNTPQHNTKPHLLPVPGPWDEPVHSFGCEHIFLTDSFILEHLDLAGGRPEKEWQPEERSSRDYWPSSLAAQLFQLLEWVT